VASFSEVSVRTVRVKFPRFQHLKRSLGEKLDEAMIVDFLVTIISLYQEPSTFVIACFSQSCVSSICFHFVSFLFLSEFAECCKLNSF